MKFFITTLSLFSLGDEKIAEQDELQVAKQKKRHDLCPILDAS
jgi:hypothetical protein